MDPIERFFQRGLKLSHLRLLTMFASLGQVRLVAERLNVTQPAVSKQLAELEAGLGTPVLARVGNRLQFTATGEALLKRAREILLQLEQARQEVDALSSGLSGTLAIGAVATLLPVLAPELALLIKKRAPNVAIQLTEDTSDKLFPMLEGGALDLVFSRVQPPDGIAGDLVGERLFDDPIVIVCGREHPLASRRSVNAADLVGLPWILPPPGSPTYAALSQWMQANGLSFPPGCVQSISLAVNEALLRSYPLVGLMPISSAQRGANSQEIHVIGLPGASFLRTVWAFYSRTTGNSVVGAALECVTAMRDRFGNQNMSSAAPDGDY